MEKRQVAYKIRIGDLMKGNIIYNGDRFSALEVKEKKIARVNIICNVVDKYSNPEKSYNTLTIDDGTDQIRIKAFSDASILLNGLEIGDTIKVIGWIRSYNDELYIAPEIAVRVDSKWAYVRKLELIKEFGEFKSEFEPKYEIPKESQPEEIEEEVISREKVYDIADSPKSTILKKIKENKDGIDIEQLIMALNFPVDQINEIKSSLISEGEIYESRPGYLRSLD
jgi:hypothetical protein